MRLAIITCYKQPDYIRAQTLRHAAKLINGVDLIVIKNKHLGMLRYPEVIIKLIAARLKYRPEIYLLTFRAYEILPIAAILTWPKKLVYDEFINPTEWLNEPRNQKWPKLIPQPLLKFFYRQILRRCELILADTAVHAEHSKKLIGYNKDRFLPLPVSTNETMFQPQSKHGRNTNDKFRVFFYANMLPLHGLEYVLNAAVLLADLPIEFKIVGGNNKVLLAVHQAQRNGAKITYRPWLEFSKLPSEIHKANLCLGGPFGGTTQANYVITGKTYQFLACQSPTIVGQNKASKLFIDKQNCLLVPQKNASDLAKAIGWAYHHQAQLPIISKAGRQLYKSNFSNQVIAQQLELYLQSV